MDIKQVGKVIMAVKEFIDSNKDKTTYWIGCGSHFDIFQFVVKMNLLKNWVNMKSIMIVFAKMDF